jgi:acylphosphatase
MDKIGAKILVSGWVQGVYYRAFTETVANKLGLTGYCENLQDGRVLVDVEGESNVVDELIRQLWIGPPRARVTDVHVTINQHIGKYHAFSIHF